MAQQRKPRAAARQETFYQPSWLTALLALALAMWLAWHGMARAEDAAPPQDDSDAAAAAGAAPMGLPCTDQMDFSPEDNLPDPFDADSIAWHPAQTHAFQALRLAVDGACSDLNPLQKA